MLPRISALARQLRQLLHDEREYKDLRQRTVSIAMPITRPAGEVDKRVDAKAVAEEKVTLTIPLNRGPEVFDSEIWRDLLASRSNPFYRHNLLDDGGRYFDIYEHDIPFMRDLKTYLNMALFAERLTHEDTTWPTAILRKLGLLTDAYRFYENYTVFNSTDSVISHQLQYIKEQYVPRAVQVLKQLNAIITTPNIKRAFHYGLERVIEADEFARNYQLSLQPAIKPIVAARPALANVGDLKALEAFNSRQQSGVFSLGVASIDKALKWKYSSEFDGIFVSQDRKDTPGVMLALKSPVAAGNKFLTQPPTANSHGDITPVALNEIIHLRNAFQGLQDIATKYDKYTSQKGIINTTSSLVELGQAVVSVYPLIGLFSYRNMFAAEITPRIELFKKNLQDLQKILGKIAGLFHYYEDEFCLRDGLLIEKYFIPFVELYSDCLAVLNVDGIDYIKLRNLFRTDRITARESNYNNLQSQIRELEKILEVRDIPLSRAPFDKSYQRPMYEQVLRMFPIDSLVSLLPYKQHPKQSIAEVNIEIWETLLAHIDKYMDDISVDERVALEKYRKVLADLINVKKSIPFNPIKVKAVEMAFAKLAKEEQMVMNALHKRKLHLSKQARMIGKRINSMKGQQLREKITYYITHESLVANQKFLAIKFALNKCYAQLESEYAELVEELKNVNNQVTSSAQIIRDKIARYREIDAILSAEVKKSSPQDVDASKPKSKLDLIEEQQMLGSEILQLQSEIGKKSEILILKRKIRWRQQEISFLHEAKALYEDIGVKRTIEFLEARMPSKGDHVPSLSPQTQVMLAEIKAVHDEPSDYFSPKCFDIRTEKYEAVALRVIQKRHEEIKIEEKRLAAQVEQAESRMRPLEKEKLELEAMKKIEDEQKRVKNKDAKEIGEVDPKNTAHPESNDRLQRVTHLLDSEKVMHAKYKARQTINTHEGELFAKVLAVDEKNAVTINLLLLIDNTDKLSPQTLILLHEINLVKKLYQRDRDFKGMSTAAGCRLRVGATVSTNLIFDFMQEVKLDEKDSARVVEGQVDELKLKAYLLTLFAQVPADGKTEEASVNAVLKKAL